MVLHFRFLPDIAKTILSLELEIQLKSISRVIETAQKECKWSPEEWFANVDVEIGKLIELIARRVKKEGECEECIETQAFYGIVEAHIDI